jgi:hypothetical protein
LGGKNIFDNTVPCGVHLFPELVPVAGASLTEDHFSHGLHLVGPRAGQIGNQGRSGRGSIAAVKIKAPHGVDYLKKTPTLDFLKIEWV